MSRTEMYIDDLTKEIEVKDLRIKLLENTLRDIRSTAMLGIGANKNPESREMWLKDIVAQARETLNAG